MSDLEPFGAERAWLAIRGQAQAIVLEALGLTDARVVDAGESVRATASGGTAVLPPLSGTGGRWTLVVGEDASDVSARRIRSLSAMLATTVQFFGAPVDGSRTCLLAERGTLSRETTVDGPISGLAAEWSVDPTGLTGPAPGQALLTGPLRPVAPDPGEPPEMPTPWQRGAWLWQRGGR